MSAALLTRQYAEHGKTLFGQGNYVDALEAFRSMVAKNPDEPIGWSNLGLTCMQLERWSEAEEAIRRFLIMVPDDLPGRIFLGIIHRRKGDLEASIAVLRQALDLSGPVPAVYTELGQSLLESDRLDEAQASFQSALKLKPRKVEAWTGLAAVRERQGREDLVPLVFQDALKQVNPERSGPLYAALGRFYRRKRDWDSARSALAKAIAVGESDPEIAFELGLVCLVAGDRMAALEQASVLDAIGSEMGKRLRTKVLSADATSVAPAREPVNARSNSASPKDESKRTAVAPGSSRRLNRNAAPVAAARSKADRLFECPASLPNHQSTPSKSLHAHGELQDRQLLECFCAAAGFDAGDH